MSMLKIIFVVLILISFNVIDASAAIDQSICSPGSDVVLYPNGSLKSCVPKDSFGSNEVKCNSQNVISLYENGQLETCVLAESVKVSGQECKEFRSISFYPDGRFKSCVRKE